MKFKDPASLHNVVVLL